MAKTSGASARPYGFDKGLEHAIAHYCCTSQDFYGRVGTHLETDALGIEAVRLLVQAAHVIAKESGRGPHASVLVLQRLNRWMGEGKIDENQVLDCQDVLNSALDEGVPPIEALVDELVPVIRRRMHFAAAKVANKRVGENSDDLEEVVELIRTADALGKENAVNLGTQLDDNAFDVIAQMRGLVKLSTGIAELDLVLEGGLPRSSLGVAVGDTGDGKSMFLSHIGAMAYSAGLHVAYATLELPEPLVLARMAANLSGVPITAIVEGNDKVARAALARIGAAHCGLLSVREFTAHATRPSEIFDWSDKQAAHHVRPVDVLLVDYADKLGTESKTEDGYVAMRKVYEDLRVGTVARQNWMWTASQSRRKDTKGKKRLKDVNDLADSQHKARVADVVVTLNVEQSELDEESLEVTFFVAKHRMGQGRKAAGPMPTDFATGRMVMR